MLQLDRMTNSLRRSFALYKTFSVTLKIMDQVEQTENDRIILRYSLVSQDSPKHFSGIDLLHKRHKVKLKICFEFFFVFLQ